MKGMTDVELIRIFMGESAQKAGKPAHELIVEEARKRGMAGVTVTRGFMGFGASSFVHTAKILRLSEDLPVVVEIVDIPDRVADFLPVLEDIVEEGTVLVLKGRAVMHCPMRIRDVMSREVVTVEPGTPASQVARLLLHKGVKAAPVIDKNRIVGIITGGDLLQRASMDLRLELQTQLSAEMQDEHFQLLQTKGLAARDIMTSPAQTINVKTNLSQALARMTGKDIKRLPVVDDDGKLMGIVSRVDVLRSISRAAAITESIPELPQSLGLTAGEVMFQQVPTASPESPLTQVLEQILATPLRRVVVVDRDMKVLGIVVDGDILARLSRQKKTGLLGSLISALSSSAKLPAGIEGSAREAMNNEVLTVLPEAQLTDVIRIMVDKGVKRLVVVDSEKRLQGIIDREVVMRALAAGE